MGVCTKSSFSSLIQQLESEDSSIHTSTIGVPIVASFLKTVKFISQTFELLTSSRARKSHFIHLKLSWQARPSPSLIIHHWVTWEAKERQVFQESQHNSPMTSWGIFLNIIQPLIWHVLSPPTSPGHHLLSLVWTESLHDDWSGWGTGRNWRLSPVQVTWEPLNIRRRELTRSS